MYSGFINVVESDEDYRFEKMSEKLYIVEKNNLLNVKNVINVETNGCFYCKADCLHCKLLFINFLINYIFVFTWFWVGQVQVNSTPEPQVWLKTN